VQTGSLKQEWSPGVEDVWAVRGQQHFGMFLSLAEDGTWSP
jgi:hypothetical protein